MISTVLSFILSVLSAFGVVPNAETLVVREGVMTSSVDRIALLKSFSLEPSSSAVGFVLHLPFNKDSKSVPQMGGDLPVLEPLMQRDLLTPLELDAAAALAVDTGTKTVLFEMSEDEPRALASLTKLATALVVVGQDPEWDREIEIVSTDVVGGESVKFSAGDLVSMRDLFFATLVGSANNAAVALVRGSGLEESEAVSLMNEKAREYGLEHTSFVDVTGLRPGNISTAREFAILASNAFANQEIFEAVSSKRHVVHTSSGAQRTVLTTNWLLRDDKVVAGKTGYIDEAGYNLATLYRNGNRTVLTIVFGATSQEARFAETERLIRWLHENFDGWE